MKDTECGLCVSFQNSEGYFQIEPITKIDSFNKNNFYFYSSNVINLYNSTLNHILNNYK